MTPAKRTEPERVAIGLGWCAAALLCVFVFPEIEELRTLMGPLVLMLFAVAGLMAMTLAVVRATARGKRSRTVRPLY
jgi:peptidoglycan/LPS O-acetylase OafA/YrhL